ncbi:MAG: protein tyrosine phosphatase [Flavobacteriaceae bacterium]|nr:protein tyrosine phosphatase [Flavobacteriaceae bacterium]|tara:strand:+ start:292718 stop:293263 length:546 start_codon:yes stop_codon:yes gene_type:complete
MIKKALFFFLVLTNSIVFQAQEKEAEKIELGKFKRLYKISEDVYRSEQPSKKGFKELEAMGIQSILNLRRRVDDNRKAKGRDFKLFHIRIKTKELTEDQLIDILKTLQKAEKPVLVHCWHGSDRTGITIAAYRIVFENWSKEAAIAEFRKPEFGYHENWYPNLLDLLNNLDVDKVRKELGF